ncbi:dynein heavy chain 17, axonemal-like isoform X2 [Myripristis murdjan]|uniref:dynein heavy chain 17, axonemal-like isoform X2 n=1 Tax=Myripristis murdjan TaxID=586833 RepID=UPI001176258B|nr:dynein heavy chain 17, axonemal-like isoform X2 [Myripristis murdjan]
MYEHIDQLQNKVLEVKGQVQEQTFLPPPGSSAVLEDAAGSVACEGDRKWLHTLESVVIMWAEQVCELLQQDWAQDVQDRHKLLPQDEFDFWKKRLLNLQGVHTQLMNPKAIKLSLILEKTESMYWPILRSTCRNVEEGLREAEDIVLHMEPLQKILQDIEHMDYSQVRGSMVALLDAVSELWSRSQFYCRPRRMVTLLQELCNNFISMTRRFLRAEELLQGLTGEPSQTLSNIRLSIQTLQELHVSYSLSKDGNTRWDFPSQLIFYQLDAFLDRLHTTEEVYCVCVELYQLEGVELPGSGGGAMTNTLLSVYDEFLQSVKVLAESKCDATSPQDQGFLQSLRTFWLHVRSCEIQLGSVLCRAVDACAAADTAVKVLQMFGFLLARPLVQEQLRPALGRLVQMLSGELDRAQLLLQDATGSAGKNTPPAAGRLHRAHQLRQRVELTMKNFRAIQHLCLDSPEVKLLQQRHGGVLAALRQHRAAVHADWSRQAEADCQDVLQQPVISPQTGRVAEGQRPPAAGGAAEGRELPESPCHSRPAAPPQRHHQEGRPAPGAAGVLLQPGSAVRAGGDGADPGAAGQHRPADHRAAAPHLEQPGLPADPADHRATV